MAENRETTEASSPPACSFENGAMAPAAGGVASWSDPASGGRGTRSRGGPRIGRNENPPTRSSSPSSSRAARAAAPSTVMPPRPTRSIAQSPGVGPNQNERLRNDVLIGATAMLDGQAQRAGRAARVKELVQRVFAHDARSGVGFRQKRIVSGPTPAAELDGEKRTHIVERQPA